MFHKNLISLRKFKRMTQEDLAEKLGVSRQAIAKWEAGETVPDLEKCKVLADVFEVSLDDLANFDPEKNHGLTAPPKGKHIFGVVTVAISISLESFGGTHGIAEEFTALRCKSGEGNGS